MNETMVFVAVLLTACGAPAEVGHEETTSGGEAQACLEVAAPEARAEAAPPLEGRWFLGEVDDDDIRYVLEVRGDDGVMRRVMDGEEESSRVRIEPQGNGLRRLVVASPDHYETSSLFWSNTGPGQALVFRPGDDDLSFAWRATPVPEALWGQWVVEPPDDDELMEFAVSADHIDTTRESQHVRARAWGVGTEAVVRAVAVEFTRHNRVSMTLLHLSPIGDNRYIAWENGTDDYVVFYRPGDRPTWLAEGRRPPLPPGSAAEPAP